MILLWCHQHQKKQELFCQLPLGKFRLADMVEVLSKQIKNDEKIATNDVINKLA